MNDHAGGSISQGWLTTAFAVEIIDDVVAPRVLSARLQVRGLKRVRILFCDRGVWHFCIFLLHSTSEPKLGHWKVVRSRQPGGKVRVPLLFVP